MPLFAFPAAPKTRREAGGPREGSTWEVGRKTQTLHHKLWEVSNESAHWHVEEGSHTSGTDAMLLHLKGLLYLSLTRGWGGGGVHLPSDSISCNLTNSVSSDEKVSSTSFTSAFVGEAAK